MCEVTRLEPGEHMRRKQPEYWMDLVGGVTGRYKTEQIQKLLAGKRLPPGSVVVDVGAGTSDLSKMVAEEGGVDKILCIDYDAGIVDAGHAAETDPRVEWRVADARHLDAIPEAIGAITFFDVLHEVYSFVGRGDTSSIVDHQKGVAAVRDILAGSAAALAPGGLIVITDDVLPEETGLVVVRARTAESAAVVRRIVDEYPSRDLQLLWSGSSDTFTIPARNLATLLTQYNKPKRGDLARWRVEQMEVHQYMSAAEMAEFLHELGLETAVHVGTPDEALAEWSADFEVVSGLVGLPEKRVALVAQK